MAFGVEYDHPEWVKALADEEQRLQWRADDCTVYYKWCTADYVHRAFNWDASRQWPKAWREAKQWNYRLLYKWDMKRASDDFPGIKTTTVSFVLDDATEYFESKKPKISRLTFL